LATFLDNTKQNRAKWHQVYSSDLCHIIDEEIVDVYKTSILVLLEIDSGVSHKPYCGIMVCRVFVA